MAEPLSRVRPGDLITADFFNDVLDRLEAIDRRLAELEVSTPTPEGVHIVRLSPTGPVRCGAELRIIGRGFGVFTENAITVGGTRVAPLRGTDGELVINLPVREGIPESGQVTRLIVSNPRGFARTEFTLLPPVANLPIGLIFVTNTDGPTQDIEEGDAPVFEFTITAQVNLEDDYMLEVLVDAERHEDQWNTTVLHATDNREISSIRIPGVRAPATETRRARVRVTVPGDTDGTVGDIRLRVRSRTNPQLARTSEPVSIEVGSTATPPQSIAVNRSGVIGGSVAPDGTVTPTATRARISFNASVPTTGDYNVDLGTAPPNWTITPRFSNPVTAASTTLTFEVDVRDDANAAAATLTITVTSDDDTSVFGTTEQMIAP